jgi:hypothetical protein
MSPPEVWGPPIWTLFHTLIERINERYYHLIYQQLFNIIKQICNYLPCPECSTDATIFLSKIKIQNLNTKSNFKNMIYLFHNYVNKKKRKPLFNFSNIAVYKSKNLLQVIKNFLKVYNTKGNMKLLTQSFQRQMVINNFRKWIMNNIFFFQETPQPSTQSTPTENIKDTTAKEDATLSFLTNNVDDNAENKVETVLEEKENTVVSDDNAENIVESVLEEIENTVVSDDNAENKVETVLEEIKNTVVFDDNAENIVETVSENNATIFVIDDDTSESVSENNDNTL